jgi:hypothetical protein
MYPRCPGAATVFEAASARSGAPALPRTHTAPAMSELAAHASRMGAPANPRTDAE